LELGNRNWMKLDETCFPVSSDSSLWTIPSRTCRFLSKIDPTPMMEIPIDSPLQLGPRHREVEDLTPRPLRSHPAKSCIDWYRLHQSQHVVSFCGASAMGLTWLSCAIAWPSAMTPWGSPTLLQK
jgi:hypothetical protein